MTQELYGSPKTGGDILSYCGKCKLELAHVIIAMVGVKPARVICKTCRAEHNYRGTPVAPKKGRTPRVAGDKPVRTTVRASEFWETKLAEKKDQSARNYSPKENFNAGEILSHPNFGLGLVEAVRGPKIEVLFREGGKVLMHQVKV